MSTVLQKDQESAFAEVIESTLHTISGCCWQWNIVPEFGSIVKIQQKKRVIYTVIYDVKTITLDPMREIHVYQKTEEEMRKEYPHLFDLLKTTFQALIIGYSDYNHYYYEFPKTPIQLYSFITYPNQEELEKFFSDTKSISLLIQPSIIIPCHENLILSVMQKQLQTLSRDQLAEIMIQYAFVSNASYRQLKNFFDRIV